MRLHREERGGILALSAVMIPVFILLAALVVDVGTWFTHKRQLQNRADSAALAAGVEYATRWAACVQNGDPLTKSLAATAIEDAARQYAGDPGVAGTLRNTEITEQGRVNVEVNSTSNVADPNTSWNDIGINGTGPCDPQPTGDGFSSAGNYWLDVKVRERDQPTLFGLFGLDLIRNTAQARVELKTADAGSQFIPIAVPEQDIRQAQIRYYNHCDPNAPVQLAKATLRPVDGAYQTASGTTLWAPTVGDAVGGTPTGISITWPASTSTCGPYAPIGAEVRIAGVDSNVVDIDALSCQQLQAARFADCWTRVSNIRVFNDNPTTEPCVQGGHPGRRDLRAGRVLRPHDVGLVHVRRLGRHRLEQPCHRPPGEQLHRQRGRAPAQPAQRAERQPKRRVDGRRRPGHELRPRAV